MTITPKSPIGHLVKAIKQFTPKGLHQENIHRCAQYIYHLRGQQKNYNGNYETLTTMEKHIAEQWANIDIAILDFCAFVLGRPTLWNHFKVTAGPNQAQA